MSDSSGVILVVDDNEITRYARTRVLRREGFRIVEGATGGEGLALVESANPDLVILDIQLPDINGLEVCKRIKTNPRTLAIPVLHMSATSVTTPDQVRGLEGGADGYLVEPTAPEVLVATVRALLRMRQAEREARESRRALDVLVGNLPGAAYRCEQIGGPLTLVSGRVQELTGWPAGELLSRPRGWWHLINPQEISDLERTIAQTPRHAPLELMYSIVRRDGTTRWIWDRITPVRREDGSIGGYEGFATDMTERKRAQEVIAREQTRLEELVRQKTEELDRSHEQLRISERLAGLGTLSAGLGHDMGNLLLPMRIRLETLRAMHLPPGAKEEIEAVWGCCEYLKKLSAGLRLLAVDSSAAAGSLTEVGDWWSDAEPLLRSTLPRHVELDVSLPAQPVWVAMNKTGLTQAVFNLVQNAGDALAAQARGRVTVQFEHSSAKIVGIRVSDNGPGMSPDVLRRCVEPFFTTKSRGLSTGLGLALVYGLVREAHGELVIDSSPGQGAAFTLRLPAGVAPTASNTPVGTIFIDLADKRLQSIVASEASRLSLRVAAVREDPAQIRIAVVDRGHFAIGSQAVVLFIGDAAEAMPGAVPLGSHPRVQDIRQALERAVQTRP